MWFRRSHDCFVPKFQAHVNSINYGRSSKSGERVFPQTLKEFVITPSILILEHHFVRIHWEKEHDVWIGEFKQARQGGWLFRSGLFPILTSNHALSLWPTSWTHNTQMLSAYRTVPEKKVDGALSSSPQQLLGHGWYPMWHMKLRHILQN